MSTVLFSKNRYFLHVDNYTTWPFLTKQQCTKVTLNLQTKKHFSSFKLLAKIAFLSVIYLF